MSTFIARAIHQTEAGGSELPRLKRSVGGGGLDQRSTREMRDRPKTGAVEARGRPSPIRAWRAAEARPSQTQDDRATAGVTTAASRQPSGREAGAGLGRSALERAARMRAIEQAWKEEHARQAELDDD